MPVGVLTMDIRLPGCKSLKEKRSRIAPIIHQVHSHFNVSISETDHNDAWQITCLTCAIVSNSKKHIDKSLNEVSHFIESRWPDEMLINMKFEIF
ncbi:MAG: DUF503 domain-containing protein [Anaerolineaceae bacterium]|nr:DUF503 domain-containing protein [Anaerolineaceae bacterium]